MGDDPVDGWTLGPDDREQPAGRVLALVLGADLATFRSHEPGVRGDADPESLHQFRVSLRRARSLLAVGGAVFPEEELVLLRALSAWMAEATSPVRDLDVLLDELPRLGERIVPELVDGFVGLAASLEDAREESFSALIGALDDDRHPVLLRRWTVMSSVYRVGGGEPGADARRPAGEVVDGLLMQSWKRMRRRGRTAMRTDDRESWHDLRKAIKRFRYLVSAFEPMYPDGSFDRVLDGLSGLQDVLGGLQDHHVQASIVESVGVAEGGRAALAAGVVADSLHRDAEAAHAECCDAWSDFDRPKLRRRVLAVVSAAGATRTTAMLG